MTKFDVLFDRSEPATVSHPALEAFGSFGFPAPPEARPWVFTNFVQSLDGVVTLRGKHSSGGDISQSPEDRWAMDVIRAHADAVITGMGTLTEEVRLGSRGNRGPVFRIMAPELRDLRAKLGRGRERNIIVTGAACLNMEDFRVFDGEHVDAAIVTTHDGCERLARQQAKTHTHVKLIAAGDGAAVDFRELLPVLRRELGIDYLLCEGGPTLNGFLTRARLVDERFLTISPVEAGMEIPEEQEPSAAERANPPRYRMSTLAGPGFRKENAPWYDWISCRRAGSHQFNRYRRRN